MGVVVGEINPGALGVYFNEVTLSMFDQVNHIVLQ